MHFKHGGSRPAATGRSQPPSWGITAAERAAVDVVLVDVVGRRAPNLAGPTARIFGTGKRLRPSLAIAAAGQRGRVHIDRIVLAGAASVELLHWATLVHDDVIDGARSRHGQVTVNAREGLAQAVVTGDLLIATAFELGADVSPECVRLLAHTLSALCVGQAREDAHRYDAAIGVDDALAVAGGKTGSLLAAAGRIGAAAGGFDPATVDAAGEFGMAFGISLQLLDDILDVVSSPDRLGKPVLADFASGTITVPAVLAMRTQPELRELVRPGLGPAERDRAATLLRDPEALGDAMRQAIEHADHAGDVLASVGAADAGLTALARWPRAYLYDQVRTKVDPGLQPLLDGAFVAARGPVR
jgi:heptaprenyl diphosphate synthase